MLEGAKIFFRENSMCGRCVGKFIGASEVVRESADWGGGLAWFSRPEATGGKDLVVIEVTFDPDGGHDFHKHPRQEEVLYVLEGEVEQWVDQSRRRLTAGDSAFIPPDTVHGSFNVTKKRAKILAILGPSLGPEGYELVDVSKEAPWNTLRQQT